MASMMVLRVSSAYYAGVRGLSLQNTASVTSTSMGVYGELVGGNSGTAYGGYFTLTAGSAATGGAALFATNSNTTRDIFQLQDGTSSQNVVTVANGGATTFRNETNSASAFQIQNQAQNALLNADTQNSNIAVTSIGTTGNALSVTANSLTTGNGLSVISSSSSRTSGNLLTVNNASTLTSSYALTGNEANVSRAVTTTNATISNDPTQISQEFVSIPYTVTSQPGYVLILTVNGIIAPGGSSCPTATATYGAQNFSSFTGAWNATWGICSKIYYLINPNVGTNTISLVGLLGASSATATGWYGVNTTGGAGTAFGTPNTNTGYGTTTSVVVNSASGEVVIDSLTANAITANSLGGNFLDRATTSLGHLNASSWKPGASSVDMQWNGFGSSRYWAAAAVPLKPMAGSAVLSGAVANISSNCTVTAGSCTDSSNILNLNQQYASATGTVLNIQNSGKGAGLLVQNASSGIALAADTVNGSVSVGTAKANGIFSAGSSVYSTGTITQSGTAITGSGTAFTQNMSGGTIYYPDGTSSVVTYVSATSLTSSVSKTVAAGSAYTLVYGGLTVKSGGSTFVQPTSNTTTAFQIQNATGTTLLVADTTNRRVGVGIAAPTATLHVVGVTPASVGSGNGTAADNVLTALGGAGGNSTDSLGGLVGGAGGAISLTSGAGGNNITNGFLYGGGGGAAGAILLQGGAGGSGSTTAPFCCGTPEANKGGTGGSLNLNGGLGGVGYYGGAGGTITLQSGSGYVGAGSTGAAGNINIQTPSGGTINVGNLSGAFTQTINIGNNSTAGSTSTITIGSSVGTGVNTIQSGTLTGNALSVAGAALTTGDILNVSSSSIGRTSGNLLRVINSNTITSSYSLSGSEANISRALTSATSAITNDAPVRTSMTTGYQMTIPNYVVGSGTGAVLIVTMGGQSHTACSQGASDVTYGAFTLTKLGGITGSSMACASFYYLLNPPPGSATVTMNGLGNASANGIATTFYGVNTTSPATAFNTPNSASTAGSSSSNAITSLAGERVVEMLSVSNTPTISPTSGQSVISSSTSPISHALSLKNGVASTFTSSWGTVYWYASYGVALKPSTGALTLTGAVANISSNCTVTAGSCTDSSNILNLNQQYASATGAVLNIQNSGKGAGLLVQNASSGIALAADTVNGSVSVGTAKANGIFSAGSSVYSTGTITQSGTAITGSGTAFTQNMSGGYYLLPGWHIISCNLCKCNIIN